MELFLQQKLRVENWNVVLKDLKAIYVIMWSMPMWQFWREWGFHKGLQKGMGVQFESIHQVWQMKGNLFPCSTGHVTCSMLFFSFFEKQLMGWRSQHSNPSWEQSTYSNQRLKHTSIIFLEGKEKHPDFIEKIWPNLYHDTSWKLTPSETSPSRHTMIWMGFTDGHPVSTYHVLNKKIWKISLQKMRFSG